MEKSKILFRIFLRFLKENNFYNRFMHSHIKFCKKYGLQIINFNDNNINEIICYYGMNTFRDIFLHGVVVEWNYWENEEWYNIDKKWYRFYYNSRLYTKYIK